MPSIYDTFWMEEFGTVILSVFVARLPRARHGLSPFLLYSQFFYINFGAGLRLTALLVVF